MARRMIDPQVLIKSQIADDKYEVDLHELLEKYGIKDDGAGKSVTLQIYSQEIADDNWMAIISDTGSKGAIVLNTAITISKKTNNQLFIKGLLVDNLDDMNFLPFILIDDGDYENGIKLTDFYSFDVHVIKV